MTINGTLEGIPTPPERVVAADIA